jgi:CRISPR/Cas system CSM-associated protein Csm3 (group 7 of RAMP superfamily)
MSLHLNPLHRKLLVKFIFEAETPVSVGVGGEEVLRQVLRIGHWIVIPSTTWKGAFRAIAERLAKTMELDGLERLAVKLYRETQKRIVYTPRDTDQDWETYLSEFKSVVNGNPIQNPQYVLKPQEVTQFLNDVYVDIEEVKKAKDGYEKMAEGYLAYNCPIGRLFGNHVLAGKVRFMDTIIDVKQTHFRPGIGIDRRTAKVREGILYYIESIPSKTEISLRIVADNLVSGETDTTLFNNTLDYIQKLGLQIGTRKTAGMGLLSLKNIQKIDLDLKSDSELKIVRPYLRQT